MACSRNTATRELDTKPYSSYCLAMKDSMMTVQPRMPGRPLKNSLKSNLTAGREDTEGKQRGGVGRRKTIDLRARQSLHSLSAQLASLVRGSYHSLMRGLCSTPMNMSYITLPLHLQSSYD